MAQELKNVIERYKKLADPKTNAYCLICVSPKYNIGVDDDIPLEQYNFPKDAIKCVRNQMETKLKIWEATKYLEDDKIRSMAPYFGFMEHSCFFGGKVFYGGNTSYVDPPLKEWNGLSDIHFDNENENYKMLLDGLYFLKQKEKEYGFLTHLRGGSCAMEMANSVRGNDYFLDLYDEEDNVQRLSEICLDAQKRNFLNQWSIVGESFGGIVDGMGIWLPGHAVGHISEDTSSMCSADTYKKFGAPYTKRFLEDYDCALMHVHVMGMHILPLIHEMKKVRYIQLSSDPNQVSSIDVCRNMEDLLKDKIMVLQLTEDEINSNLEYLKTHKTIVWYEAPSKEKGLEMIDIIKSLFS